MPSIFKGRNQASYQHPVIGVERRHIFNLIIVPLSRYPLTATEEHLPAISNKVQSRRLLLYMSTYLSDGVGA